MNDPAYDARERAVECLAERLHCAMEHLDPIDDRDWLSLDEFDREFFRQSVKAILLDRDVVEAALGPCGPPPARQRTTDH